MNLVMRRYQREDDFWKIRDFLRRVLLLNGLRQHSWHVARLDYWRWHGYENCHCCGPLQAVTFIWETPAGEIAAVLNPESRGEAFFQVHPAFYSAELLAEMLNVAEDCLSLSTEKGHKLNAWVDSQDELLTGLLQQRGFGKGKWAERQRRRLLFPLPDGRTPEGYVVRSLGDASELPARSWASWRAFHPDEPDARYEGWEWYHNIQRHPLYRRDLDLVAVAPGGEITAFATVWYDDVTRTGYFEPVGTMPEHRRRGLGKALVYEGLRRLERMGGILAFVTSSGEQAHALYASAGFTEYDVLEQWVKEW